MTFNNQDTPRPRFTGLFIPVEILEMEELTSTDHMLLAWIDGLYSKEHGGCFASNEYFAKKLKLKENTIKILITKLVDLGLVERVSFNGRQRILRACKEKWFNQKHESTSEVDLNQPQGLNTINLRGGLESHPHIYIDKRIDQREYTPPIPPQKQATKVAKSAKADEIELDSSSNQKEKTQDHEPIILEIADQMIDALKKTNPGYKPPRILTPMLTHIDFLIRIDKRTSEQIIDVFKWALADSFWADKMFKANPAKYLREKFDQLYMKMIVKPPKKERKFAPCSDDNEALRIAKEMAARAI